MRWILLLLPLHAFAADLSIEHGKSTVFFSTPEHHTESKYTAISIRSSGQYFAEVTSGAWYGESDAYFAGVAVGAKSPGKYFAEVTGGAVKLFQEHTAQLDGDEQFIFTIGVGRRIDNASITLKARHFSNGGREGENHGQDFMGICVAVGF